MKWLILLYGILHISGFAFAVEDGHFSVDLPKNCSSADPKNDPACFRDRRSDEFHNELEIVDDALVLHSGERGTIFDKSIHIQVVGLSENPDRPAATVLVNTKEVFHCKKQDRTLCENQYYGLYGLVGKVRVEVSISGYQDTYVDLNLQTSGDIYTLHMLPEASRWRGWFDKPQPARMTTGRLPHDGTMF